MVTANRPVTAVSPTGIGLARLLPGWGGWVELGIGGLPESSGALAGGTAVAPEAVGVITMLLSWQASEKQSKTARRPTASHGLGAF
ncbi:MAG: hypothetical protein IPF56_12790 [Chloroflexi bacterium]|nr:hypothetical protein [Chloroflexota bacterium]